MASLFLSRRFTNLTTKFRRNLSSFNNNRTRTGIISSYDDELNLWSENNWSHVNKQFNCSSTKFPLPGQTGLTLNNNKDLFGQQQQRYQAKKEVEEGEDDLLSNQFDLFYRPLPIDHQMQTLMQISNSTSVEKENKEINNGKSILELKAHKCPVSLAKDFQNYFPTTQNPLTVVTVSLQTVNDMSTYNNAVEEEREHLMKQFVDIAQDLCVHLKKEGHWVDFIDPSSGRPALGPFTHVTFYETDERYRELGFEIVDYGCCKVIKHHKWGTRSYVGCVITTASTESNILKQLLSTFN